MPKLSAIISVGNTSTANCGVAGELRYQMAVRVKQFAREAGIPFTSDMVLKAEVKDLPELNGCCRQLVELEL